MYHLINGWTKARMIERIRQYNNGKKASASYEIGGLSCLYLTPDGNRCAVGCFIPDDRTDALEFLGSAGELLDQFPSLMDAMPLPVDALEAMQACHDNAAVESAVDMRERLATWIHGHVDE